MSTFVLHTTISKTDLFEVYKASYEQELESNVVFISKDGNFFY